MSNKNCLSTRLEYNTVNTYMCGLTTIKCKYVQYIGRKEKTYNTAQWILRRGQLIHFSLVHINRSQERGKNLHMCALEKVCDVRMKTQLTHMSPHTHIFRILIFFKSNFYINFKVVFLLNVFSFAL
jgi:hypothetical protein